MEFENILEFKGKWRSYQARVLDSAAQYLSDNKIHIVAAPGSGKTTLGIELISRLNEPALVLVPSITIREQWVARIEEAFLCDGCRSEDYLSQSLKNPKAITVVTYQALYSAMTHYKGKETETTDENTETDGTKEIDGTNEIVEIEEAVEIIEAVENQRTEEVDYSDFDMLAKVKEAGIRVLCLDECHHLRNEWWKALEDFKSKITGFKTIALTATPPYDSTPDLWKRYMNMCGEIDEEITTPELVKEGSLCPHQDYVYFNYPTSAEKAFIVDYENKARKVQDNLMQDQTFASYISTHRFLNEEVDNDTLLDNPIYLASIIMFAHQVQIPYPGRLKRLLGVKKLPEMDLKWMEALLQGFLYDDVDSFSCDKVYREQLITMLKQNGLIEKRKVMLASSKILDKLLINSLGKCNSIKKIVFNEYDTMGKNLRLLVLTDYIRKEYEKVVGDPQGDVQSLGVIPFFEMLRRENTNQNKVIRFGILCGSIVVIPAEAKQELDIIINGIGKVTYSKFGNLPTTDYLKVTAIGNTHFLTAAVTNLFEKGYFQVLIGTKSLLGEGWDSPCINSLILASFVGSFMLSNQMRGRAIRIMKGNPEKTSNIWHLVCLRPWSEVAKDGSGEISQDFSMMVRRMQNFLGLHYKENTIESGIDRFSIIKLPLNKHGVERINNRMLALSRERSILRNRWNSALAVYEKMEVVDEVQVKDKRLKYALLTDPIGKFILTVVSQVVVNAAIGSNGSGTPLTFCILFMISTIAIEVIQIPKIFRFLSPFRRLKSIGIGIRSALEEQNLFDNSCSKAIVESISATEHVVFLKGGSGRDKDLFAKCVNEFFGEIDNQRYILVKNKFIKGLTGYYPLPDCFAKKKEDAELFANCMKKYIGKYKLVYTRNEEGRKCLLEGRVKGLMNREARVKNRKKVKGALE